MVTSTTNKTILQGTLKDEDAFSTSLLSICVDAYGTDVFEWDPRTLWISLAEDFGVSLPSINKDKIQALILVHTTDLPFVSVEAFNHVCNVLSGSQANFRSWDMLSPEEALWGIYEMMLHAGVDREQGETVPEFSHEIRRYLGTLLREDGIFDPPDILRIAEMDEESPGPEQWADDPVMFNAASDHAQTEKLRLMQFLGRRLGEMLREINRLPLQHKNTEGWQKFREAIEENIPRLLAEQESARMART
jgi:hypothetical protein